jgi:hypothetical protein
MAKESGGGRMSASKSNGGKGLVKNRAAGRRIMKT